MKKFLFTVILAAVLSGLNQVSAQCAGASVTITNIVVTNPVSGVYNVSYRWTYNQGNASVLVVLKCGGVVVDEAPCNGALHQVAGGVSGFYQDVSGIELSLPGPCAGVKEIEFRIYASSNCNGTFCPIGQNITLPVKFASFNADRSSSNVNLTWSTASEQNNSGFAVERNTNGSWVQIAWVPTQAANGNSDALLNYSYIDQNSIKGITQYRIRQVDFDAKSSYSMIRSVRGLGQLGSTIVYPNPSANGKVNIVFENTSVTREISIADMSGRVVRQIKGITNNNITIENLNPGMYTVRIVAIETGEQVVEKIVVNKR